jgi:hypothetical protein
MLGIVVGLWHLAILGMACKGSGRQGGDMEAAPIIAIGTIGVLTIGGCITALATRRTKCFDTPCSSSDVRDDLR